MLTVDHVVTPLREAEATSRLHAEVLPSPRLEALSGDDWDGRLR